MRVFFLVLISFLFFSTQKVSAKDFELYSQAFGKAENPALIFLHGGPGVNAYSFEFSTAQKLSEEGFYVIVFDQRGDGRSNTVKNSKYTFEEATTDLNELYEKYHLKKASLIAHSFGGTIALFFSEKYPEKLDKVFLVSAPISYQEMFKTIISNCRTNYTKTKPENLKYLDMIEKTDSKSLEYSTNSFFNAMACGLYTPTKPSEEAQEIYKKLFTSKDSKYLLENNFEPVEGFYKSERYTTLDLSEKLKALTKKIKIYGIYASEDGLFNEKQLKQLKDILGSEHFKLINNASHSIFLDQQKDFIKIIKSYSKE